MQSALLIRIGQFFFKYRDGAFPLIFSLLLLAFPPALPGLGKFGYGLALAMALVGQGIRTTTVGLQYIIRGGLNKQVYADDLVTGGLFAHCRNPLYVGNILMVFSLLILADNDMVYLLGGLFILGVYVSIVAAEEQFLRNKFGGQFESYCRRVHRWWFDLGGIDKTLSSMTFNWRRVWVKEYSSFSWWCLAVLGVELYKTICYFGLSSLTTHRAIVIYGLMLGVIGFYLMLRFLKKSRRLTESAFQLTSPVA